MDLFIIRLKELRQNKAVSQKNVGIAVEISGRAYNDIERGRTRPAFDTLISLADYFDVSLDYLAGRSEIKERR